MRTFQIIMTLFVGIGAVAGATMMWVDPTGKMWGMEPLLEMLRAKMPWPDVFFKDFIPSGYVLLALNGLPQLMAAILLIKRHRLAPYSVMICGSILMLWIILEWGGMGIQHHEQHLFCLWPARSCCRYGQFEKYTDLANKILYGIRLQKRI